MQPRADARKLYFLGITILYYTQKAFAVFFRLYTALVDNVCGVGREARTRTVSWTRAIGRTCRWKKPRGLRDGRCAMRPFGMPSPVQYKARAVCASSCKFSIAASRNRYVNLSVGNNENLFFTGPGPPPTIAWPPGAVGLSPNDIQQGSIKYMCLYSRAADVHVRGSEVLITRPCSLRPRFNVVMEKTEQEH